MGMGNYCCCYGNETSNNDIRRLDSTHSYQNEGELTTARPRRPPNDRGIVNNGGSISRKADLIDGPQNKRQTLASDVTLANRVSTQARSNNTNITVSQYPGPLSTQSSSFKELKEDPSRYVGLVTTQPTSTNNHLVSQYPSQIHQPQQSTSLKGFRKGSEIEPTVIRPPSNPQQPNLPVISYPNLNSIKHDNRTTGSASLNSTDSTKGCKNVQYPTESHQEQESKPSASFSCRAEAIDSSSLAPSSITSMDARPESRELSAGERKAKETLKRIQQKAIPFIADIVHFEGVDNTDRHYFIEESLTRLVDQLDDLLDDMQDNHYLREKRKEVYQFIFELFDRLDRKVAENKKKLVEEEERNNIQ